MNKKSRTDSTILFLVTAASWILLLGNLLVRNLQAKAKTPLLEVVKIGGDIYLAKGEWGSNVGFYVANNEVLAIDSKATAKATEKVIKEFAKIIQSPITRVAFTHSDPDSFNGREAYPDRAGVICSLGLTKDNFRYFGFFLEMNAPLEIYNTESWPTSEFVPAITFDGQLSLRIGQKEVQFIHYGPAHTRGDAIIFFPEERVAFIGDLVFIGHDPIIQSDKGGSCYGLIRVLSVLLSLKPEIRTFIPSHADPIGRDEVQKALKFVEGVTSKVESMFHAGKTMEDVKKEFGVPAPPNESGTWVPPNFAASVYHELAESKIK